MEMVVSLSRLRASDIRNVPGHTVVFTCPGDAPKGLNGAVNNCPTTQQLAIPGNKKSYFPFVKSFMEIMLCSNIFRKEKRDAVVNEFYKAFFNEDALDFTERPGALS